MGRVTKKNINQPIIEKGSLARNTSIGITVFTMLIIWIDGYIYTNYYTSKTKPWFNVMFLVVSVIAFIGFIVSAIASTRTKGRKKYIYILCTLITLGVTLLELVSVAFLNSLTSI